MEKEEKIKFCHESAEYFETHTGVVWETLSIEALDKAVDFFDYLWEK